MTPTARVQLERGTDTILESAIVATGCLMQLFLSQRVADARGLPKEDVMAAMMLGAPTPKSAHVSRVGPVADPARQACLDAAHLT